MSDWIATVGSIAITAGFYAWGKKQGKPFPIWVLVVVLLGSALFLNQGLKAVLGEDMVSASVDTFVPIDEANLSVTITFENAGSGVSDIGCTVEAHDASGSIVGFEHFTPEDALGGGDTVTASGVLRIEDEGAFRVTDVTVEDCT